MIDIFYLQVLQLLKRYLGEYVHGLSLEALRVSVWKGDVVLKDLKLKAEALNSLKLPVTVKAGFIGTITLKVPWKSLGKEPVIVLIDRVFVLADPAPDGRTLKEEDRERLFQDKLHQIEETEAATLEAMSRSKLGSNASGNSWLGSLIATIIGNLKITISNVHIRYEDTVSNYGHPFACGVTLAKLAAVTMDEQGNETFDTSGALDKLRKSLQLERLAIYHDSDKPPWQIDENWQNLSPSKWIEIFEEGINEPAPQPDFGSSWALNRTYLVAPINGVLRYHRLGSQERNNPEIPFEKASLFLNDVSLTVTEAQYYDWLKLVEVISRYRIHVEVLHLRPGVPVSDEPRLWWHYAVQATLQQRRVCYSFSWERIQHLCQLRRRYIHVYANFLQQLPDVDNEELRQIERDLDSKVILLWRLLAHAKVESAKSKEAAVQKKLGKRSWFSLNWQASPEDDAVSDGSDVSELTQEKLTKEEWQAINNLLSYQPDGELALYSGKDGQNMVQFLVDVSIGQAAAKIIDIHGTEVLCGRFELLKVSTKLKHRSTCCDLSLRFYGLYAPEGSLAQSVCSEQKENALVASFVRSPVGENVDWRLSAIMCPCHVTILMESYERVMEFLKRSNAVSPTVAIETATALQMKFEKVTRKAQEQFQLVLEEQSRFALDVDFDAPKVRVPIRTRGSSKIDSLFLLDFGHFTLRTKEGQHDEDQSLYSRFYISGRDIAAFFTECGSESNNCSLFAPHKDNYPSGTPVEDVDNNSSLLDRCGMAVIVDQIKVPHPNFPSTRISVQVPNLGIHISPARYSRLMELLNIFYTTLQSSGQPVDEISQPELAPWKAPDMAAEVRILVWKGIGNSVAAWQPSYVALSGFYLYVLESERAPFYQRCTSMAGKQVFEVPPANVGGSLFSIAVCFRGMDIQKALESSGTLIIEFPNEDEKYVWLKGLVKATYQASAPLSDGLYGDTSHSVGGMVDAQIANSKAVDLVINGTLVETKLFIYGQCGEEGQESHEETLIVELTAGGGKVHVIRSEGNLTVKMKLHSLRIKDELRSRLATNPQYLAYSIVISDQILPSSTNIQANQSFSEEEEIFRDALPEFTPAPDIAHNVESFVADPEVLLSKKDLGKGKGSSSEIFYEALGSDNSDFVSVTFMTKDPSSPEYEGIDTQMNICMSKLEFFCNRPTIVALIQFGLDTSSANFEGSSKGATMASEDVKTTNKSEKHDDGDDFVKGLLGYGKGRVVFKLSMDVDSVTVFLNQEDGSQFAMFIQESFILDLRVHPCSISIEGTLGNLRLRDMSLGVEHCWNWLCDIRNPGAESLIKFAFKSYSAEDDDYEGYDYSLTGRLSAVRIVFLYRFIREITVYFMELATPHKEEVIKFADKVGGFEWMIRKHEIDGATAVKLDLSLDTPIIIIPKHSMSKDFMQLDLGQLKIRNEFSWHGCPDRDPSAVHLDVLRAEVLGINLSVGIDGSLGRPMMREGHGLVICVRRSLRDVFRKVPTHSIEVQVDSLHGVMSDKEYNVILNCAYTNMNEEPKLPPSFRASKSDPQDTMKLLVDRVNANSQNFLSRTVSIVAVEIKYALLELCTGIHEESTLAHISLEGLWVSYRMTSLSEADLYVTIPKFSIVDVRPDAKPEMRLMLGSSSDVGKQVSASGSASSIIDRNYMRTQSRDSSALEMPTSTMFLLDYRWRASSQSSVVRVQQPRILVVPDFLIAVAEFFVPSVGSITGREESMDPNNDPIRKSHSIVLQSAVYRQQEEVIQLSSSRQLIADAPGIEDYVYDGCGRTICLKEDTDMKESQFPRFQPIIVIGCGKRLRFVNVKIENGSLLRNYTYLSNDSSYSASPEDGVDIKFLESNISDESNDLQNDSGLSYISYSSSGRDDGSKSIQSFTFEAQVVSPELTFYDGTKSSLDDSPYSEKLVRAKFDLSFMYASQEDGTWIRALLKDLTIEAGSGLVVLSPVDVLGGYTSVKEKTNISLSSTDLHLHLSLSIISLLLNLQTQVSSALQFGDANPLASCTNFERIWVSPKENGPQCNLTFWRPRAPSNYVILGDCVTSRSIPPSQAMMAVYNTYGRVRKPLGFKLIGLLSEILEIDKTEQSAGAKSECSLWFPIAPPGYTALGCAVNVGDQPPPNHVVHCIRADLVTSTSYSECLLNLPSNSCFPSGFSIWRLDNILGSFYSHPSADCPSKQFCYDLIPCLKWRAYRHHSSYSKPASKLCHEDEPAVSQGSKQNSSSSGWDILRSRVSHKCFMSVPNFERIWWDKGGEFRRTVSIWRPIPRPGYAILGDCITDGLEPPTLGIIFLADNPEISAKPVKFTKVAQIFGKGVDEAFFWYPVAPPGYAAMGCIVTRTDEPPRVESFCCPRIDLVGPASIIEVPVARSSSLKASQCWSIWKVDNQASTFLARSDLKKPSSRLALSIGDSVKPKVRENVTSEMKLGCLSVTILDSLGGMMTPFFDATFNNIKLVAHGRFEVMSSVLICSMAASTFNTQLEAWEPFLEPFEGIFKFDTYDTSTHQTPGLGKTLRIAATTILNLNISAANLDSFAEAVVSWKRQREVELRAEKLNEESVLLHQRGEDGLSLSALDEDDLKTIVVENKLGCDIYIKKLEQNSNTVEVLHDNRSTAVWLPPPRLSDKLNVTDKNGESRYYIAVRVLEAKDIPIVDDGNSHNFFCALRLVVDNPPTDQQKFFPQSARTKCVRPFITKALDADLGTAKWDELFIFEVPQKGTAKLEAEVTNLAAKAGKGEVVGASSFPAGHGSSTLTKIASSRMLHQQNAFKNIVSHPLRRRDQEENEGGVMNIGSLLVSTSYFERKLVVDLQKDTTNNNEVDSDVGFWIALRPDGPWESSRSVLPLSVFPKSLEGNLLAMEVITRNGKKHAIFRGLATVVNETNVKLDLSLCPLSMIDSRTRDIRLGMENIVTLDPGSNYILPWRCISKDSEDCLRVRPYVDLSGSSYSWGLTSSLGFPLTGGKEQHPTEQGLLSRQSTMKLNELEKKDVLLCCIPSTQNQQFWLSVGIDASIHHTELNAPVYDWKISINSPLKLENRLPCPAEFSIWQRKKDGKGIELQQSKIYSRKSANINAADLRKPVYLSLFVQGGWTMEKESVVILDLSSDDIVSSFWMVQQHTKRRLRVSIERDLGGTSAAPKTIRLFIPYWIVNDSSLPLAYRMVEIEPLDNGDSSIFKSAKYSAPRKNVQVLDVIGDTSSVPSMLSPQDYVGRGNVHLFTSRNDTYLSPKVGIALAIFDSENYSPGISLVELEKKGRVDVTAFCSEGSYYKFSAQLNMTSDRTKVIRFQPHTLYINRVGFSVYIQQCHAPFVDHICPTDPPKAIRWHSSSKVEMLKLRVDGYKWSRPFSVGSEGMMSIVLESDTGSKELILRVAVRSGTGNSRYEVIFRPNSLSSPYRIENRSMFFPIHFRQVDGTSDSWRCLPPNAAASYLWEDVGRRRLLELFVDGSDPQRAVKYNIDEVFDHQPMNVGDGPTRAIRVAIVKEEKMNVVKLSDWMPQDDPAPGVQKRIPSSVSPLPSAEPEYEYPSSTSSAEFHVVVELSELGLSVVDHTPEEILYLSVQNLLLSHSTGLGSGTSRFKLKMRGLQVDNQLPLAPMPVLFRPQKVKEEIDYILKFSVTSQSNGSLDLCVYPYIGFHGCDNSTFLINVHEPIIWRLHEMIQQINLNRINAAKTNAVSIDPIIQIGVLDISEVRLKVSMIMSPTQRPKGVLGFWASLMTALGNMENMPVRIHQRFVENVSMRQSAIISNATSNIQKDLLSQPLQLLSGVDILGNASSALEHMSKGAAAISMDKKFIQSRQNKEKVGDFGDVVREGGGALAKSVFRGVTGMFTKPIEGAKSSGVEGFVQGVGKGIIGVAAQPVSGVLDLIAKTTEGANAMRMKIQAALTSEVQLLRRRLPRVVSGDNLLRPYDEYKAQGQVILQLAESGSFLRQVDLFKVRGKFALSDAYEDHFMLPKGKIFIVTHRRAVLLQQPLNIKFSAAKDPCSILWDVIWDDLVTMELTHGKKDQPNAPPSRVILYLQTKSIETKDQFRKVRCNRDSNQAFKVYAAIEQAMSTYGPNKSKGPLKKVTRPYSPKADHANGDSVPKEGVSVWSTGQFPASVPTRSLFGSSPG
ncbi:uncharacterized protein LOC110682332 isoform X2 [Chenopodium quinoa]|uniref:uncharacterized protein LOC110682332 isoform X2 n=1 Tax=Chenopodium quinoa TaxID=63459 RepID=UPI000B76E339|nr:uncharacterized protein LOC110682332 isoform X2 [Chenopodium quinoa]